MDRNTTPSYDRSSSIEQIKQTAIQEYEAQIQELEHLKQELNGKLQPEVDVRRKEINTAIEQHSFVVQSLQNFQINEHSTLHDKLGTYKKELIYIATHPNQVSVNKGRLESLSKKIEEDSLSFKDDKDLNKLKLITDFLKTINKLADECKKSESSLCAQIEENSTQIDEKITEIRAEIATLRGGTLEHVATYQRNLQGDFVQTAHKSTK